MGFYAWRKRPKSSRASKDAVLSEAITNVYTSSRGTYGSPRVHAELREQGEVVGRKRVARLMRDHGLVARCKRRFRPTTTDSNHQQPVAENLLNRSFERTAPNQAWVGDITYIPTGEGWLNLTVLIDLFSRRVVGWAMSDHIDRQLPFDALEMAVVNRGRAVKDVLHHSDRGSQYASADYRRALADAWLVASMSRKGNSWDNAVTESFFSTLKWELIHRRSFETRSDARRAIFEYIEVFYNRRQRHSALAYLSPMQFESNAGRFMPQFA